MKEFIQAFQYALKGIAVAFKSERNIKVHFIIATFTIAAGLHYNITTIEWCAVILCIGLVLALEMINTAIEDLVDLVTLEWKPLAGKIKDAAAGGVLVASVAALIVGIIIFRKYLI